MAQSHTPHDCCVRFAPAVADRRATLASRRALPLTCAGLPPAGSRQLACGAQSIFPRACGAISIAPAAAGPGLHEISIMAISLPSALRRRGQLRACSRSSRRNSRPQLALAAPIVPAESAHSICSAFAAAFPARSQALPRTRRSGERGSKGAQRLEQVPISWNRTNQCERAENTPESKFGARARCSPVRDLDFSTHWAPKPCPFVASIGSSFYSTSADYDRAISIAEINLSKSLRRHFHRVIASACAGPNLLGGIFLSLSKACSRSSRKNSRPQARARGPTSLKSPPIRSAQPLPGHFQPARRSCFGRDARASGGSKAAQRLAFKQHARCV